ncbi:LuxR C-terminal-related transcriptional regulator [Streptomyces sp. cg36]|uniref:helix-turn-helix transcriptional regulator n=1 Tax=Streptomyces sp. cg36 TaxID=3238798 RepID=UPI0034E2AF12
MADAASARGGTVDHCFLAVLAAELAGRERPVVLVLDDFRPAAGSALAEDVVRLLRRAGSGLRLVVVCRQDAPLPLHRLRLSGELTEIRADDLAFDDDETAALLGQHGIAVSRVAVRTLRARTEGWAAGLRLAALSMVAHTDPEQFVRHFAGDDQAVSSYLFEEVLEAQPDEARWLMLVTSVPDCVNSELAAALAGPTTGRYFSSMVEQNSFFRPLGHGWYRSHRMFRTFLRLRLQHEAPGLTTRVHRRAATWFSSQGLVGEAVHHAVAAGDWRLASRMVVQHLAIGQVLGLTEDRSAAELFQRMPQEVVVRAALCLEPEPALLCAATALFRGDEPTCAAALAHAERVLARAGRADARIDGPVRLARAVVVLTRSRPRDVRSTLAAATEAEAVFDRLPREQRSERPELRSLILVKRGGAQLCGGRLKSAEAALRAGLAAAVAAGSADLRDGALERLALLQALRGRFREAEEFAARVQGPVRSCPGGCGAWASTAKGWAAVAAGRPDAARDELNRAEAALRASPEPFVCAVHTLVRSLVSTAEGRGDRALRMLASLRAAAAAPWLAPWFDEAEAVARLHRVPARGGSHTAPAATGVSDEGSAPVVEALSKRELEVVAHLAQMMTTEEIAAAMHLSVNTVKTHLKHAYRKLAVTRRTAAVRRVRELQLL